MSDIPRSYPEFLLYCQLHAPVWRENSTQIGLTSAQTEAFSTVVDNARAAYDAQQAAKLAAKSATMVSKDNERAVRAALGDTIKLIRAFAVNSSKPTVVYDLAQIPAPAAPTPLPPPGQPFDFRVELEPTGAITLRWKASNPVGSTAVVYNILRQIGNNAPVSLGAVGERSYTDESIPAGSSRISYTITPQRGTKVGMAGIATVNFGFGSGPTPMVTLETTGNAPQLRAAA